MPRKNLDTGLRDLQTQILRLAADVEEALTTTLTSLETGEHHLLSQVVENDCNVDTLCIIIEQQALRLLILQQPLGGQDLRFLTAALHIGDNLGRINNAVVQLAQAFQQATSLYYQTTGSSSYSVDGNSVNQQGHLTDAFILRGLLSLGHEVLYRFHATTEALDQREVTIAHKIEAEQNLVDLYYIPICQDMMKIQAQASASLVLQRDTSFTQRITYLLWMAHKLAEIAAYVTNICKRIIFIVEG